VANNNRGRVPEEERCKGTSRQSKERCKRRRSPGSGYCIFHGGRAPKAAAHPGFRDGRRSKYMPQGMLENYERHLDDPELTHHRSNIAIVDAALDELFESYSYGSNPGTWKAVRKEYSRMKAAHDAGDRRKAREHFEALGLLVEKGHAHAQQSLTLLRLLEARRKHAAAETKRRLAEERVFTLEQAAAYYSALGSAARRWFGHDRERLTGFLNDVMAIGGEASVDAHAAPDDE